MECNTEPIEAALQDLLLIPRSPSPLPLEERPVEELSLEQLHEIVRRHQVYSKYYVSVYYHFLTNVGSPKN